jgi:hypothetical protein
MVQLRERRPIMNRLVLAVATLTAFVGTEICIRAQPPINRPTVSPYLNLARPDSNPALNYYNLVRPEFAVRGAIRQLEQNAQRNQDGFLKYQEQANELPATGHAAGFQTHLSYFGNPGGTRSGVAAKGPAGGAAAANRGTKARPSGR